jgi:hypothetical protein
MSRDFLDTLQKNILEFGVACKYLVPLIIALALGHDLSSAQAGPCAKIKQFERAVRNSKAGPGIGPSLPQSIGAQLSHQPTPKSVKQAERRAKAGLEAVLERPKKLDAEGKRAASREALTDAKLIYLQ